MDGAWDAYERNWGTYETATLAVNTAKATADEAAKKANATYETYRAAKKAFTSAGGKMPKEPVTETKEGK